MIRLAPIALLLLAILVPLCTGTVWGNVLLLAIASGIFFGTISLTSKDTTEDLPALQDTES